MEAKALKQERMDCPQLMSSLESAIKVWKSEQGLGNTTTPPPKAFRESSRENVLQLLKASFSLCKVRGISLSSFQKQ